MQVIKRPRDDSYRVTHFIEKISKKVNYVSSLEKEIEDLNNEYKLKFWYAENLQEIDNFKINYELKLKKIYFIIGDNFELRHFFSINSSIRDIYSLFVEKYNKISKDLDRLYQQLKFDFRYLYDFEAHDYDKRSLLNVFNTETRKTEIIEIKSPEELSCLNTLAIQLPYSKLFILKTDSKFCCIIDIKTYQIDKILPYLRHIARLDSCGCYYKNSVYNFESGWNKENQRFDIVENRWHKLALNSNINNYLSCICFRNSIMLCCGGKMLSYDFIIDSFSEMNIGFHPHAILRGSSRAYAIFSGYIYESDAWNDDAWNGYVWRYYGVCRVCLNDKCSLKFNQGILSLSYLNHGARFYMQLNYKT